MPPINATPQAEVLEIGQLCRTVPAALQQLVWHHARTAIPTLALDNMPVAQIIASYCFGRDQMHFIVNEDLS